jgi:cystathionine beta-lyase/cystathionine gamma-synthase
VAVAVDNTFASPYVQRPIEFGADLVVHSTTKFLNGHSDSVGGVVVATRDDHIEWLRFVQNAEGAILGPMDAWLVLRGTKTLPIRMERHNANAMELPRYLAWHPESATTVKLPRASPHPQHALAQTQMRGLGGLISFGARLARQRAHIAEQCEATWPWAESPWRGRNVTFSHPATMTHASVPARHAAAHRRDR